MTEATEKGFAPRRALNLLRPFIPKRLQPMLRGLRKRYQRIFLNLEEPYRSVFPYTQAHPVRQANLVKLAGEVLRDNVPGALIECGVLDGGMAALMSWASREANPPRAVHLFDAWLGLPKTTAEDGTEASVWQGEVVGSPRRVSRIMKTLGVPVSRVTYHRGWFNDTFPGAHVSPVALAHIDCDFYEPTRLCLEKWYPVLSPGGFMQFDDYAAFSGCQKAVDEFLAQHHELKLERAQGPDGSEAFYFAKPK